MKTSKARILYGLLFLAVGALPTLAEDKHNMSNGSKEIHEIMVDAVKKNQSMEMSGDTDKDFAMTMADHHRSGIKMAKAEVENGKNAELKAVAQKIVDAQQKELTTLDKHAAMSH